MYGNRGKNAKRAASDLAHLMLMPDGLPLRSEDSVLRWREIKFHSYGSARLHVLRAKTDRPTERSVLSLGPAAGGPAGHSSPQRAVIGQGANVSALPAGQISCGIKAGKKMASLGDDFGAN